MEPNAEDDALSPLARAAKAAHDLQAELDAMGVGRKPAPGWGTKVTYQLVLVNKHVRRLIMCVPLADEDAINLQHFQEALAVLVGQASIDITGEEMRSALASVMDRYDHLMDE